LNLFKTIQIRRKYFSKIKASKYIKQEKCDKCLELKEKREKAVSNAEQLQIRAELAKIFKFLYIF
jgi:hypothetical protein